MLLFYGYSPRCVDFDVGEYMNIALHNLDNDFNVIALCCNAGVHKGHPYAMITMSMHGVGAPFMGARNADQCSHCSASQCDQWVSIADTHKGYPYALA